jgi:RNA polymerase sigma-70 factor (ECF subfamily)
MPHRYLESERERGKRTFPSKNEMAGAVVKRYTCENTVDQRKIRELAPENRSSLWRDEVDPFSSQRLQPWLDRIQAGDRTAEDELMRSAVSRLERLARKMLHRFPAVQRWADTGDIVQNASLRLLRSLREVRPANTREFFSLAAEQMRRELLDLNKHFYGPEGEGANHASHLGKADSPMPEPPDQADDMEDLERWQTFHEAVARLPVEEREVIGLVFYHGWKQAQIAELFQVDERTVRRRWQSACLRLKQLAGDNLPTL